MFAEYIRIDAMKIDRFLPMATIIFMLLYCGLCFASTISNDIVFMIDNSGSMKKGDPHFLTKTAVTEFVKKLSDDTQVAVLIFDHRVNLAIPLTIASEANKEAILASFDNIDYKGILTNIPDAMKQAIIELKTNGQDKSQKSIVFITDGVVDTGKKSRDIEKTRWMQKKMSEGVAKSGIKIFGIAFTNLADFELIQSLVQKTNGEYFDALTSEEIPKVFSQVYQHIIGKEPELAQLSQISPKASPIIPQESESSKFEGSREKPHIELKEPEHSVQAPPQSEIEQSPIYVTEKPEPTPDPVKDVTEKPEPATPPIKHVMKKPGDLRPAPATPKSRKLPLPLPIIILIAVIFLISTIVILSRSRRRKVSALAPRPQRPPPPPVSERPKGVSAEFMPEALLRDVSEVTGEDTYKIKEKKTKIGRKEKINQIVINQDTISRQHAIIEYRDYVYWIIDQDSANSTFLNGQKIVNEMRLNHGDTISFDVYDFEFILPGIESAKSDVDKTVFRRSDDLEV